MPKKGWLAIAGLIIFGAVIGAGALIFSVEANRLTSTDEFCSTSCHSMTLVAQDPHFRQSGHRTNAAGVTPSCGDCHIPKTNWFVETYVHVTSGVRDVFAENTNNFDDPKVWKARRIALAHEVRETMRSQDSVTCRSCHDATKISPASERGRAAHAVLRESRMTCIDCHFNLVHAPVPPSLDFIRGSNLGRAKP